MSRTKRVYNRIRKGMARSTEYFYHPYHVFCCGNCKMCKDPTITKRRRLAYKMLLRWEIDAML